LGGFYVGFLKISDLYLLFLFLTPSGGFLDDVIDDSYPSFKEVGANGGRFGRFLASRIPFMVSMILAA